MEEEILRKSSTLSNSNSNHANTNILNNFKKIQVTPKIEKLLEQKNLKKDLKIELNFSEANFNNIDENCNSSEPLSINVLNY